MPATGADLAVGQIVEVQGDFATGIATAVNYRSEIKGPVTSATVTDPQPVWGPSWCSARRSGSTRRRSTTARPSS